MSLKFNNHLVSADWLYNNLNDKNLIILDCTIPKVTDKKNNSNQEKKQIQGAVFFDIKKVFSKASAKFPNTVLSPEEFELKVQNLGIHKNSSIVCYDDLGVYSSPRVWWNFKLMGFKNIAVLNGGLPAWEKHHFPTEKPTTKQVLKGNFKVNYLSNKLKFTEDVLATINNENTITIDARSNGRFYATAPEPRSDVKRGHIPNAVNLPFTEIMEDGKLKSKEELLTIFNNLGLTNKEIIFTCGSGITASILALGAAISGFDNYSVYDGSWTEWGLTDNLPIA